MHFTFRVALAGSLLAAASTIQAQGAALQPPAEPGWWRSHANSTGFTDALASLGLSTDDLARSPSDGADQANNLADPLHWLRRTLRIYSAEDSGVFHIPVTESHANGRDRNTTQGKNSHFALPYTLDRGESMVLKVPADLPAGVGCAAAVGTGPSLLHETGAQGIRPGTTTFVAPAKGVVIVTCQDPSKDMPFYGHDVEVTVLSGGAPMPMYVFGVTPASAWKAIATSPNVMGTVVTFSGRTRSSIAAPKAARAKDADIGRLMREQLVTSVVYDVVNGYDGTNLFALPTQGLVAANYDKCCSSAGGLGVVNIGFPGRPSASTSWGEWHEFGHQNQQGWGWGGLGEVTVNIYSLAACQLFRGDVPPKNCHGQLAYLERRPDAVRHFIDSGQQYKFSAGGLNEFKKLGLFAQIDFSYPKVMPHLGKTYRTAFNYGDNGGIFRTSQQKIDWFVIEASRAAGRDLSLFFDRWGLVYGAAARQAIASMHLPEP